MQLHQRQWNEDAGRVPVYGQAPSARFPRHHRFAAEIFSCTVRLHVRFNLSVRDIEAILAARSILTKDETVRQSDK